MRRAVLLLLGVLFVTASAAKELPAPQELSVSQERPAAQETSAAEDRSAPENARNREREGVHGGVLGNSPYSPACPQFFVEATREIGFVPAVFATADRMTRCTKIGTAASYHLRGEDGLIHEGVEAYRSSKKNNSCTAVLVLCFEPAPTGDKPVGGEIEFIDYLIGNSLAGDAAIYLELTPFAPSDTLQYLRGWSNYSAHNLDAAAWYLSQVDSLSAWHEKSLFFAAISDAHQGRYDRALSLLDGYSGTRSELAAFERAGIALLQNKPSAYKLESASFTGAYPLAQSEKQLDAIYSERYETRSASPFWCSAASAVVPGLGKVFAGRFDEAITSFVTVGTLAAFTAECWIKCGATDWKTILFGTLGSIFYIGNIYGTYVSVGITEFEKGQKRDAAILYNIHIPLRSVFD